MYFILKFYFIYLLIHEFQMKGKFFLFYLPFSSRVSDESKKKKSHKKNLRKDKKLLADNFPATKINTVSLYQWKTGVQIG